MRDLFPFALETTIEQRGFLFTDKVAVVRSKKTREIVAEVKMDTQGFFFVERIAVATNFKTKEKISKTFESVDGFFFPERTATTRDLKSNKDTHKTKIVEEGFFFPKHFAETRSTDKNDDTVIRSKENERGLFFKEKYTATNKMKVMFTNIDIQIFMTKKHMHTTKIISDKGFRGNSSTFPAQTSVYFDRITARNPLHLLHSTVCS
ncbi:hypothetical protein MASR2M69_05900 [Bacteroidota bacterium]